MTDLQRHLADYLTLRRGLGYSLKRSEQLLKGFLARLAAEGVEVITTESAVAWATEPAGTLPTWWGLRLGVVREFARYVQAFESATQVPPRGLLPTGSARGEPYPYQDDDVAALMGAAGRLAPKLRAFTYTTLIGLLATTGMRVGEAIALDRDDVDLGAGVVTVSFSKGGGRRHLPVSDSTAAALAAYRQERDTGRPGTDGFFVSTRGTRLIYSVVHRVFDGLVEDAALPPRGGRRCRPRLHGLRHRFAVTTLIGWYRAGVDVDARLPVLASYLGHRGVASTYWYLGADPELLALASQRREALP